MKKFNFNTIIIYILLVLYLLFSTLYGYSKFPNLMSSVINPLFYILLTVITFVVSNSENNQRIKAKTNKYQTIFIVTFSYLIIYVLLGLLLGYVRSIYSHTIIGIIKNIWMYILPVVFTEIIRNILIRNSGNNKFIYVIIVMIFTLIELDLYNIFDNNMSTVDLFKLTFETIIPVLISNIVLTYISKTSGYITNLIYLLPQKLTNYILPILPNLDWYFRGLIGIILPLFAFILIKNLDKKLENTESRTRLKKESPTKIIPVIIPLVILALFVAGFFKYKPTSIVSNSMFPVYKRGDVIIVEKITKDSDKKLKKYDIIEYKLDNIVVAHRIIHIEEHNDGTKLYITKGDNNNVADNKKVTPDQILGVVKFKIPKIGYPAVWLNDFFNKNRKVSVETGK